jgi:M6 family metalloprotease-like protein
MKKILISLFLTINIPFSFSQEPIPGETYVSYYDSTWSMQNQILLDQTAPELVNSPNHSPYGGVFTPKGTIRTLIIFARFTNDNNQACGTWVAGNPAPSFVNFANSTSPDLIFKSQEDFGTYSNTANRSLSRFYGEMSKNQFSFFGNVLSNVNGSVHCIEVDPTSNNPNFTYKATGWADLNLRVMTKMKQDFPNFDWSPYDLHKNKPSYKFDASLTGPDSKPDYVIIMYRYSSGWVIQPVPDNPNTPNINESMAKWSGSLGGYSILNGLSNFTYNGYSFDNAGFTFCTGGYSASAYTGIMHHEIAHELFSCPHIMGANAAPGDRWQFPAVGWGMMSSYTRLSDASHGWERWILGWTDLTSGASQINTDIQSSNDLQNNGIYTLRDFVATGDVIRIKVPHTSDNYLWIENHQLESVFDHQPLAGQAPSIAGEIIPEMSKGVYMYLENVLSKRDDITTALVTDMKKVNGIKLLNAQGNYDYSYEYPPPATSVNNYWNNVIFNFKREKENPISGLNPYFRIPDDFFTRIVGNDGKEQLIFEPSGAIDRSLHYNGGTHEDFPIIRETNANNSPLTYACLGGVNAEATNILNRRLNTFQPGDEVSLSGIVPALNYPLYNASQSKDGVYTLNGLKVNVLSFNSTTKEMQIKIAFDDFTIQKNKRWCGFIELVDNTMNTNPDLILKGNITLEIDRNGNANRHTKHHYFNFINPSTLTCTQNSYFNMESSSKTIVDNFSTMFLDSLSKLEINDGAVLSIKNGSTFNIKSGANLIVKGTGKFEIEPGAYICIESGANITLQDALSTINLRSGYLSGMNPLLFSSSNNCVSIPNLFPIVGNGSINTFSLDLYIQNQIFQSSDYLTGKNIFAGTNVTLEKPQGPVVINNGASVIFDTDGEIFLAEGFEVQLGASFETK